MNSPKADKAAHGSMSAAASTKAAETRRRLIEAAIECLAEKGYGATTLQEIARTAGMTHGPLQYHFRSRVELLAAVSRQLVAHRVEVFRPLLEAPSEGMLQAYVDRLRSYSQTSAFMAALELLLAARGDADLRDAIAASRQDAPVAAFAAEISQRTGMSREDVVAILDLLAALSAGMALNRSVGLAPPTRERAAWRRVSSWLA